MRGLPSNELIPRRERVVFTFGEVGCGAFQLQCRLWSNSTVRLHLWDGSLPLDSFRAVRVPATEVVGPEAVFDGADLADAQSPAGA